MQFNVKAVCEVERGLAKSDEYCLYQGGKHTWEMDPTRLAKSVAFVAHETILFRPLLN